VADTAVLAAKKMGLAEVPVIVLDHLDENQRRATCG
jgi:ParB-like chromosome segregation protein Spo0J